MWRRKRSAHVPPLQLRAVPRFLRHRLRARRSEGRRDRVIGLSVAQVSRRFIQLSAKIRKLCSWHRTDRACPAAIPLDDPQLSWLEERAKSLFAKLNFLSLLDPTSYRLVLMTFTLALLKLYPNRQVINIRISHALSRPLVSSGL